MAEKKYMHGIGMMLLISEYVPSVKKKKKKERKKKG